MIIENELNILLKKLEFQLSLLDPRDPNDEDEYRSITENIPIIEKLLKEIK